MRLPAPIALFVSASSNCGPFRRAKPERPDQSCSNSTDAGIVIQSVISDNDTGNGGTVRLITWDDGAGNNNALTLNGANTFTGGVTHNRGTLSLGNSTALGTGTLTMNRNAAIDLANGLSIANDIVVGSVGTATRGIRVNGTATATLTGSVDHTQNGILAFTTDTGATLNLNGDITSSAARQFNFQGDGLKVLAGDNDLAGVAHPVRATSSRSS
jgi:autotransporter-associated beta strand protein